MPIKIEASLTGNSILINGVPYNKGNIDIEPNNDKSLISFYHLRTNKEIVGYQPLSEFRDNNDNPFATFEDFVTYLDSFFFRNVGGGGSGQGWSGTVDTFADLPAANSVDPNTVYLVRTRTGSQLTFNLRRSGLYESDGVTTWTKLSNAQFMFTDNELTFKDDADNTKQLGFQLNQLSTGTRRTASFQDKDGTVAYLDDINTFDGNHSSLNLDDGTNPHGTTKTDVGLSNVDNTSDLNKPISNATQLALDTKLDDVIAGANITIDKTDPLNPVISLNNPGTAMDYIRVTNSVSQVVNTTSVTNLEMDTIDVNSNNSLYTLSGNVITILSAGRYNIKAEAAITSVTTQRADPLLKVIKNGSPIQDSLLRDITSYGFYARNSGSVNDSGRGWDYVVDVSANDTFQIQLERNNIDLNGVSTIPNGTYLEVRRLETASGGGSSSFTETVYFSMLGQASSATGLFGKASLNQSNPSGLLPTSSPFNQYVNGSVDPYVVIDDGSIVKVSIALAKAAVGTGSVNPSVSIEIEVYKINNTSETLLDTYVIPLDPSNIGIFNNLGGNSGFKQAKLDVNTPVSAGDLIGVRFNNVSGDNTRINSISRCQIGLEILES